VSNPAHTEHVARLALGCSDERAAPAHPGEHRATRTFCGRRVPHYIGMSVDYDDHHKHSRYLILNCVAPAFSSRRRCPVAQAARYHRKGMPDP